MKMFLFITLELAAISGDVHAKCLKYEPVKVALSGRIMMGQAYGPPNYGENPRSDSIERYPLLKLDTPICVDGSKSDLLNTEYVRNLRAVQMVYLSSNRSFNRAWIGHHVTVWGSLFHSITGHHHTKVLITVTNTQVEP